MAVLTRIRPSEYHDSVTLMLIAKALLEAPGVSDAAVVMGTPANRALLASAGLLTAEAELARPDDLVIVVSARSEPEGVAAQDRAIALLSEQAVRVEAAGAGRPRSLQAAIAGMPGANLAVISVAGRYAAIEARTALEQGLHVLLFSDNVPLEDEISLKTLAAERGLLCMGPDAGTAIVSGIALGFANAVPRGRVGLVSAAGTGLQAVTCGIARRGAGVSQALGTGGRDLSAAVGGRTMQVAMRALQEDPDTAVMVLISKPPAAAVAEHVLARLKHAGKPTVVCFLGADPGPIEAAGGIPATNLTQAAAIAAALARGQDPDLALEELETASKALMPLAAAEQKRLAPRQHALRGLFAGGTFCYEAQLILRTLPEPVLSNAPLSADRRLREDGSAGHLCLDLGGDEYTQGRLHPMIDPTLRNRLILREAHDPQVAVILLDIVLGYGAHPDPAGAAAEAADQAQRIAAAGGRHIAFIASVCGTEGDPQRLSQQEATLEKAGVLVQPDNASAARLAGLITQAEQE